MKQVTTMLKEGIDAMFTQIFDTHSHYTDSAFDQDRDEVLRRLPEQGVVHTVLAGTTIEDSAQGIGLTEQYDYLYAAVGIHPETAGQEPGDYLAQLAEMAKHPKVVAIGEIGLDYHYEGYDREAQITLLREQLDLAKQLDLPVIIHARDCTEDYLRILTEFRPRGVVHCFSGSAETARQVLALGMYIGFTGVLTFKNAKKALKALAVVPEDKLLLETDCPYMAPVPFRGKRCDSAMIPYTAEAAALVRGTDTQTILEQTCRNGERLFGIPAV
ncbi:TatD family hydrolase [uncultured Ruminococcus sp.]|uniref:TatD family hydrolase n=1 Tax=uncultured Ruminococcus sp. TaxID=165186 RepID=UPI002613A185|nr:TatD family hydrolase [uncultured Ruminococcus sp.]